MGLLRWKPINENHYTFLRGIIDLERVFFINLPFQPPIVFPMENIKLWFKYRVYIGSCGLWFTMKYWSTALFDRLKCVFFLCHLQRFCIFSRRVLSCNFFYYRYIISCKRILYYIGNLQEVANQLHIIDFIDWYLMTNID